MASFVILISGTALPSPTPTCNTHVADVVLVLESSYSIRDMNPANGSYNNWNRILSFVSEITRQLNVASNSVHVGLDIYSQCANNEFFLDYSYFNATLQERVGSYMNTSGDIRFMHEHQFTADRGAWSGVD